PFGSEITGTATISTAQGYMDVLVYEWGERACAYTLYVDPETGTIYRVEGMDTSFMITMDLLPSGPEIVANM
ncbi:MAG: hypothetical protein LBV63_00900, partial [Candidatus Methanoplasma sp.]|nr:hypothetical protein [Candidatus Methanoplasma sp.]